MQINPFFLSSPITKDVYSHLKQISHHFTATSFIHNCVFNGYESLEGAAPTLLLEPYHGNEQVLMEALDHYHDTVASSIHLVHQYSKENFLHVLIKKRMGNAIVQLCKRFDVRSLLLAQNQVNHLPLNIAINLGESTEIEGYNSIAGYIWDPMLEKSSESEMNG